MSIKITPRKLHGSIDIMPSKSHAHRLLIASKLAQLQSKAAKSQFQIPSFCEDIAATKDCLLQLDSPRPHMPCRESASTLRFLLPVTMALRSQASFGGLGLLPTRPLQPLVESMGAHGCSFNFDPTNQTFSDEMFSLSGRLTSGDYYLPGNISSQFISGLLFALPLLDGTSRIILTSKLESAGYVDMTLDVLTRFGVDVKLANSDDGFSVYIMEGNQRYIEPDQLYLEGDWSNAAFWLAAGALSGDIVVRGLSLNSCQRDKEIISILSQMGADLLIEGSDYASSDIVSISTKASVLRCIDVDISQTPDLAPVLASLMAFAEGSSMLDNCERLRYKESNRIRSIYEALSSLGADISYGGDKISITGKSFLEGGGTCIHNDHRIVMAAALASCLCMEPIYIEHPEAVTKSYPSFFKDFAALGASIEYCE